MATNYPSPANRFNVAIYTPFIFQQLKQMPRGATVFMSLGTNDAVGGLTDVKARVDQIVATAQEQGIKLIWMGPPCVRKDWEVHSPGAGRDSRGPAQGNSRHLCVATGPRVLRGLASRRGRRAFYYGGLFPHVAEGGDGRGHTGRRRLGGHHKIRGPGGSIPATEASTKRNTFPTKPPTPPAPH